MKTLFNRLLSPTPRWFKNIAWVFGLITLVCGSLTMSAGDGGIHLSAEMLNWLKIIGVASAAVAGVSLTAKRSLNDKNPSS